MPGACWVVAGGKKRELSAFLNLEPIGCADFQDNAKKHARERICGDGELEPLSGRFLFLVSPSLLEQRSPVLWEGGRGGIGA